jgi:hypothetical protein
VNDKFECGIGNFFAHQFSRLHSQAVALAFQLRIKGDKRSLDFPLRTTEQSNFWERDSMDNSAIERSLLMTYKVVSQDCCSVILKYLI